MNANRPIGFDAVAALDAYSHKERVQHTQEQHLLDISSKQRTSVMPWRGQFSPQLVEHLLRKHCAAGDKVVDPFCGSGTVLYEAAGLKMDAVGYDVNPAAIMLASFSKVCAMPTDKRLFLFDKLSSLVRDLLDIASRSEEELTIESLAQIDCKDLRDGTHSWLFKAFMLQVFGNAAKIKSRNIIRAEKALREAIFNAPFYLGEILADTQDARRMPLETGSCSYAITSPPYINVFNYHQNYRPVAEAFGCRPLISARSEMGANRKFRQNRFITVAQYCMDIAESIVEIKRVLKDKAKTTIILGRTSNVRSVSFRNGELIAAIACDGLGANLLEWNERKFLNRFGETIFEDVLTFELTNFDRDEAVEIGRQAGVQALRRALDECPEDRRDEIEQAIIASASVEKSAYYQG